jgi:hypothetical protein
MNPRRKIVMLHPPSSAARSLAVRASLIVLPWMGILYACGSSPGNAGGGNGDGGPGSGDGSLGSDSPSLFNHDGGGFDVQLPFIDGGFTAPDCPGCTFPAPGAPTCSGAPPINIVYPTDGVVVPPNMNVISVMWTPFGQYQQFEVDFTNSITDMHVVTKCAAQTMDTEQPAPQPSGGCELQLDPMMWQFIANQNRGGDPVSITVRGTTNGSCANVSSQTVRLAFTKQDVLGVIYYWKSTITSNGVGGQVWQKDFGDSNPESDVTSAFGSTCNGCHALSRDGQRMVINSDDDDSDDEYGDIGASLIDMSTKAALGGGGGRGNMPVGFATFYPDHSKFLMSHGLGTQYPPTNIFPQYDGTTDMALANATAGAASATPTMPDWSPDGKSVVFVMPTALGSWDGQQRTDDDHVFGGSLYTMSYAAGAFGAATPLFVSGGENNYYPGYSPDGQLIVFNRAPQDMAAGSLTGCANGFCPNDSFSNPAARLMLMKAKPGAALIDLAHANGSPQGSPLAWSNSWPKWSPFLQDYHGDQLLWIAFSSTRDYGLRVRNHQPGMYQCYPADSYENPGAPHHSAFAPQCQQPQIWMAAIDVSTAIAQVVQDPSMPAFWLPFQDITTHNHTPQWTQSVAPPPDAGACMMAGGNCTQGETCCSGLLCTANGTCGSITQ